MHLKQTLFKLLKSVFGDLRRAVISIIVVALVAAGGGILSISTTVLNYSILIANTPTPLWVTIALVLLLGLYIGLRKRKRDLPSDTSFHQALGVFWDDSFNMHCLSCGTLLKNSTISPSIFFCSDPRCNSKYMLKDDTGKELAKQEALDILKTLLPVGRGQHVR
jgi:hypothetical protein